MADKRADRDCRYSPGEDDGTPTPLVPIGYDPYLGMFIFNGEVFRPDTLFSTYPSIVDAIIASGPIDSQLQRYADEYKRRLNLGRGLVRSGQAVMLVGGAMCVYFLAKPNRTGSDMTGRQIGAGIPAAGGLVSLVGMLAKDSLTAIIQYYNNETLN